MYTINFQKPEHIHFIGIGGISMSGLAEILLQAGFQISGSDPNPSELTRHLESLGVRVYDSQIASNITEDIDAVVYTAAIRPGNPEYDACVQASLPMMTRAELLGQIMKNYKTSIAVAGTHGKTTTTSMLSHILMAADTDPTISVGGILPSIGGNLRIGKSETFLTEACEYTNSFLSFFPTMGIILNIDRDHLDFFKDLADIRRSFRKFARLLPASGTLVINAEISDLEEITGDLPCRVVTYSIEGTADYTAADITYDSLGHPSFTAFKGKTCLGSFSLKVPGIHNVSNALAAIAASCSLGLDPDPIREGLSGFTGTDRRFQYKGKVQDSSK